MAIIKLTSGKISVGIIVNYVTQKEKTEDKLISGVNCMPESVLDEFEMTKLKYNKLGGRTYYHMMQSFAVDDDITPEKAHEIGLQMAEHCFPGYQVLVATHIDRHHTHNHFVINSVNMLDGKKMNVAPQDLIAIKNYSNYLCEKNGIPLMPTENAPRSVTAFSGFCCLWCSASDFIIICIQSITPISLSGKSEFCARRCSSSAAGSASLLRRAKSCPPRLLCLCPQG